MPRPRKPVNYEQEIEKIDMQIAKWRKTIGELQERRKQLELKKEQKELTELHQVVKSTGMSVTEIVGLIQGNAPQCGVSE